MRVEGLPDALQQAWASLAFVGTAGKHHVAKLRMVLLPNALIALIALIALAVLAKALFDELIRRRGRSVRPCSGVFEVPPEVFSGRKTGV